MSRRRRVLLTALPLLAAGHLVSARSAHGKTSHAGPKSHGASARIAGTGAGTGNGPVLSRGWSRAPGSVTTTGGSPHGAGTGIENPALGPASPAADPLEFALHAAAPTLQVSALRAALASWQALRTRGQVARPRLSVIDYSLPSTVRRLWVFDMDSPRLLFHELVAHGRNSGEDLAQAFSNQEGSLMTSLGAFMTGTTYEGKNGYSLHLLGLDRGVNDQAQSRTIVMHGAPYVGEEFARKVGRLGRSHGCPAVRPEIARPLIDEIKDGTILYAWHPSLGGERLAGTTTDLTRLASRHPDALAAAHVEGAVPSSGPDSAPADPTRSTTR